MAIVGGSGSGKSWLAAALRARLGERAGSLCLDDFYRDRSSLPLGRRARLNFDHPRAIDWPEFEQVLSALQSGEPVRLPQYDFAQHVRNSEPNCFLPKPIVLVEGLWLLCRPALRRRFALSIYVECAAAVQLQRRLARDTAERGRTAAQVRAQFRRTVAPMGRRYVLPQKRWADLVACSPLTSEALEGMAERIWRLASAGTPSGPAVDNQRYSMPLNLPRACGELVVHPPCL